MAAPYTESMCLESEPPNLAFPLRFYHFTELARMSTYSLVAQLPLLLHPIPHTSVSWISDLGWYMNI